MFRIIAVPLLSAALFLAGPASAMASGQVDSLSLKIYFRDGQSNIDRAYRNNAYEIDNFKRELHDIAFSGDSRLVSATIEGSGSPTGSSVRNRELASVRATALLRASRSWFDGTGVRPVVSKTDASWQALADMVEDSDTPYKDEVLDIIYNTPVWVKSNGVVVGSRKLSLIELRGGAPYRYMEKYLFDECRWATLVVRYESGEGDDKTEPSSSSSSSFTSDSIEPVKQAKNAGKDSQASGSASGEDSMGDGVTPVKQAKTKDDETTVTEPVENDQKPDDDTNISKIPSPVGGTTPTAVERDPVAAPRPVRDQRGRKPAYVCFKNNLLLDVALLPNIALEFHLGHNWTMGVDWMYAWWEDDRYNFCEQIYGGSFFIRKYMGKKAKEKPLTGHHLGIYAQALTYDVDWKFSKRGYQGLPLFQRFPGNWGAGLEYGYSVPVGRRFNLDFSIAGGYFFTEYKTYNLRADKDGRLDQIEEKRVHWWGPTKVEITLVWLIGYGNYNIMKRNRK